MTDQRSDAWFAERAGRITASQMHTVALPRERGVFKTGPRKGQVKPQPKALEDYAHQLAAERLTGKPRRQIKAAALQWGQDIEPAAVAAYQAETGVIVRTCGFVRHPNYDFIGASPDFLVDHDGGGEIKSPESSEVHLATLLNGLPSEHIEQIQGGLWVTGRQWWDFVSFHPDFPPAYRLYIQRVPRDEAVIAGLEAACLALEADVQAILEQLQQKEAA
ncbi:MAG TPA: YqaJ viral recombinase family protein [Lysobacter sp.]|nr:YqaJ viral recombinase family protein [Lysobacter sp.]